MDKTEKKAIRYGGSFSIEERHQIIKEYLTGNYPKEVIWRKYTGQPSEHGHMLRWMRQLGYVSSEKKRRITNLLAQAPVLMKSDQNEPSEQELKQRIKELETQLEIAQLKAEGYEIMIDIAEKELKIPIRKKLDTR